MMRDTFPQLVPGKVPEDRKLWEISRFAVDQDHNSSDGFLSATTARLLIGLAETGLAMGLDGFIAVVDLRMERIVKRTGWPIRRIEQPTRVGCTRALAIHLPVNQETIALMKRKNIHLFPSEVHIAALVIRENNRIITPNSSV